MAGTVNDVSVNAILKAEIAKATGTNMPERMDAVRKALKIQRNMPGKSLDMNLAAAEHYAFMRYLAGTTGDQLTLQMPRGYELKKILMNAVGKSDSMRHNPANPATPPDEDVVGWGEKGAREGLDDYRFLHGQKLGAAGSAIAYVRKEVLRL